MPHSRDWLVLLFTALAVCVTPHGSCGQDADFKPFEVKSSGKPSNYGKVKGPHYFIWHDEDGWHLRTQTSDKAHEFSGTIEVVGGKIAKVFNFETLETSGKTADQARVAEKKITFRLHTKGNMDGFDFRLNADVRELRFRLLIDGDSRPELVLIGQGSQPAPRSSFSLNPRPDEKSPFDP